MVPNSYLHFITPWITSFPEVIWSICYLVFWGIFTEKQKFPKNTKSVEVLKQEWRELSSPVDSGRFYWHYPLRPLGTKLALEVKLLKLFYPLKKIVFLFFHIFAVH